jgi:hypothetical protein
MTPTARPRQLAISVTNTAKDSARIGMQIGVINGSVYYQSAGVALAVLRGRSYRQLGLLASLGGVLLGTVIALLAGARTHPNPSVVGAALAASGCWAAARSRVDVCLVRHWSSATSAATAQAASADARISHRVPRTAPRDRYWRPRPPKARTGFPRRGRRPGAPPRRLRTARPELA